jgi:hypothetical protein
MEGVRSGAGAAFNPIDKFRLPRKPGKHTEGQVRGPVAEPEQRRRPGCSGGQAVLKRLALVRGFEQPAAEFEKILRVPVHENRFQYHKTMMYAFRTICSFRLYLPLLG